MRMVRFGELGDERPGVLLASGELIDAGARFEDFDPEFFADGGVSQLREWVRNGCRGGVEVCDQVRMAPPLQMSSSRVHVVNHCSVDDAGAQMEINSEEVTVYGARDPMLVDSASAVILDSVSVACVLGNPRPASHLTQMMRFVGCLAMGCFHVQYHGEEQVCCGMGSQMLTTDELGQHPLDDQIARYWSKLNNHVQTLGWYNEMSLCMNTLLEEVIARIDCRPGDVVALTNLLCTEEACEAGGNAVRGDLIECGVEGLGVVKHRVVAA
ncbi:hypothetical protein [Rubritalea marina]|uniref:hypothetical protein n=1 Tax=Rubritalea marina TaxID=361055 RepID=UPI0003703E16|nr:hypothetical protein [Rubritalea marina]